MFSVRQLAKCEQWAMVIGDVRILTTMAVLSKMCHSLNVPLGQWN